MALEQETFFDGKTPIAVKTEVQVIPWDEELDFLNQFGDEYMTEGGRTLGTTVRHGTIRLMAIERACKTITIGHETFYLRRESDDSRAPDDIKSIAGKYPRLRTDKGESPATWLVKVAVKHNDWLSTDRPYRAVFGNFRPEPEENGNPTGPQAVPAQTTEGSANGAEEATSTNTPSSPSVTVGDQKSGTTLSDGYEGAIVPHSAQSEG